MVEPETFIIGADAAAVGAGVACIEAAKFAWNTYRSRNGKRCVREHDLQRLNISMTEKFADQLETIESSVAKIRSTITKMESRQ